MTTLAALDTSFGAGLGSATFRRGCGRCVLPRPPSASLGIGPSAVATAHMRNTSSDLKEVEIEFPESDSKQRTVVRDAVLFWGR